MAQRQTQIQIPNRREDEPPASADQLQRIRELTVGSSLHGYRFDYRKLGTRQAQSILQQLLAMNDQQASSNPTRKKGPGCIASLAKSVTALIVWAGILACVAGGGYLIYWRMNQTPPPTASTDANTPSDNASPDDPDASNASGNTRKSIMFEGLDAVDDRPPADPIDRPTDNTPDLAQPTPTPDPIPPTPTVDPDLAKQLVGLEKLLVSLSQYTRNDFAPDLRARSSEGMQKKLDAYPQALAALDAIDPTLSRRIRAAIDAFAADNLDGSALREEIKSIRQALDQLQ